MKTIFVIEVNYDGLSGAILAFESEAKANEVCKELEVLPFLEFDVKAIKVVDSYSTTIENTSTKDFDFGQYFDDFIKKFRSSQKNSSMKGGINGTKK